jgi:hypothetical protein
MRGFTGKNALNSVVGTKYGNGCRDSRYDAAGNVIDGRKQMAALMPWKDLKKIAADDATSEREKREVEDYVRRRAKPRFYADENFPNVAIKILKRLGADVLTVRDARRRGHPDENHVAEALRLGRILITCDRDYLDGRRFPLIHCPALIVFEFGSGTADDIVSTFACLSGPFRAPQFFR